MAENKKEDKLNPSFRRKELAVPPEVDMLQKEKIILTCKCRNERKVHEEERRMLVKHYQKMCLVFLIIGCFLGALFGVLVS